MKRFDISIDLDGVINSYKSGFTGDDDFPDAPNPGAVEWLNMLTQNGIRWCIFSTRNLSPWAIPKMYSWLEKNGVDVTHLDILEDFPSKKPNAHVMLDDKGLRFEGDFSFLTPDFIRNIKPWWKQK
jgi:hypothetical protein